MSRTKEETERNLLAAAFLAGWQEEQLKRIANYKAKAADFAQRALEAEAELEAYNKDNKIPDVVQQKFRKATGANLVISVPTSEMKLEGK